MPRPQWKPVETLTPFARIVREGYMWRQMPPMSVSQLSDQTGISKQTIWGWINHGSKPRRETVVQLHKTTGLPLDDLLRAAGIPTNEETLEERRRNTRALKTIAHQYESALEQLTANNPLFSAEQRAMLLQWAREELPARMLRGDDLDDLRGDLPDLPGMGATTSTTSTGDATGAGENDLAAPSARSR